METRKRVHDIKQNSHGMTKLLVAIPMSQRIGLAQVSTETSIAQQELIRMAIGSLLAEHGIDGGSRVQHARPVAIVKKNLASLTEAAIKKDLARKNTEPKPVISFQTEPETQTHEEILAMTQPSKPAPPSPDHVWVVRGGSGYWRAKPSKPAKSFSLGVSPVSKKTK